MIPERLVAGIRMDECSDHCSCCRKPLEKCKKMQAVAGSFIEFDVFCFRMGTGNSAVIFQYHSLLSKVSSVNQHVVAKVFRLLAAVSYTGAELQVAACVEGLDDALQLLQEPPAPMCGGYSCLYSVG